jgi:general stress protein YciG
MDAAKQREIASRGGRAAHAHGTAHKFSSDEARRAGRKGGEAVSGNREHMAAIRLKYRQIAQLLKWLTLVLFTYVGGAGPTGSIDQRERQTRSEFAGRE